MCGKTLRLPEKRQGWKPSIAGCLAGRSSRRPSPNRKADAMQVLIINLDRARERLAFQQAQMQALGLPFTRIAALDADHLPDLGEAYWSGWERPIRPAERACLLSHRQIWEAVASGTDPMLVLEDDAVLSDKVPALLEALRHRTDLDHVTLETRSRKKLVARASLSDLPLRRLYQDRSGAAAYILWPTGAAKLLQRSARHGAIADAVICAAYELASFQADPALAVQLDRCAPYGLPEPIATQSSISPAQSEKQRPALAFRLRRIKAQLRMGLRQLCHINDAQRRQVPVRREDFDYLKTLAVTQTTSPSAPGDAAP
ncbi:glycosyltransferase family 25 protein [Agrobacterium vitis]|nr:glycosyltransferase family 25 protein [Agrobacterium vitis]